MIGQRDVNRKARLPALGLVLTLTLPPAIVVALSASSMSLPLLAASALWYVIALCSLRRLQRDDGIVLVLWFGIAVFLILHAILSDQFTQSVDYQRLFLSLVMMTFDFIAALLAARCLAATHPRSLVQAANLGLVFLSVIGIASKLGMPAIGPTYTDKAVVIFAEPSHYGLAYLPLLLFRVSTCSRNKQILLLAYSVALGALLESLTIIAGVLLIACVLLQSTSLILLLLCAALGALAVDLTYYASRLTLSGDSDNLTTLVFLQGWDNAQINFRETSGLGVGFQQFGIAGSTGDIADRISELLGETLSLRDGGSTATKLVGEFGVLGVFALLAVVAKMGSTALYIRRAQRLAPSNRDVTSLLFAAIIVSYSVELFMRGEGYFSPGGLLAVAGFLGLPSRRRLAARRRSAVLVNH